MLIHRTPTWLTGAAALATVAVAAAPAHASTATIEYTQNNSGFEFPIVVPAGVTSFGVVAVGAVGGSGTDDQTGGSGARVTGDIGVKPEESLYVRVGTRGRSGGNGGGGGGGGASDIRRKPGSEGLVPDTRLIVAGGGGGSGAANFGGRGGDAGAPGGVSGTSGGHTVNGGGQAGTLDTGGAAGVAGCPPFGGATGTAGSLGQGGDGALGRKVEGGANGGGWAGSIAVGSPGGGGGGGVYGGGGGSGGNTSGGGCGLGGGGGGGGSNRVPTGGSAELELARGDGMVRISFEDTTTPIVTLDPIPTLSLDNTPEVSGTYGSVLGDGAVTVKFYKGNQASGTVADEFEARREEDGTYARSPDFALPDGVYTVQAEQPDAGLHLGKSEARTFTIDTAGPNLKLTSPAPGATGNPTSTVFAGTAGVDPGDSETVWIDLYRGRFTEGGAVARLTATRDASTGAFSATAEGMTPGPWHIIAIQKDSLERLTFVHLDIVVDAEAPTVALTGPAQGRSTNTTPTVTGTATRAVNDAAEVTVSFARGGTEVASMTAPRDGLTGAFSATPPTPLDSGDYTVTVSQKDLAGNVGSATRSFTIDLVGPQPTLTAPASGAFVASTPQFSGTAARGVGDAAAVKIRLYAGSSPAGTVVQVMEADADPASGAFSAPTVLALPNGAYTAQVSQSDDLGNSGTSQPVTFTVGTAPPSGGGDTGVGDKGAGDTGAGDKRAGDQRAGDKDLVYKTSTTKSGGLTIGLSLPMTCTPTAKSLTPAVTFSNLKKTTKVRSVTFQIDKSKTLRKVDKSKPYKTSLKLSTLKRGTHKLTVTISYKRGKNTKITKVVKSFNVC